MLPVMARPPVFINLRLFRSITQMLINIKFLLQVKRLSCDSYSQGQGKVLTGS
jgi:hypothetical protein